MVVFFIIIVYIIILFKQMSSIHMFLFIKRLESPVQLARVYIYIGKPRVLSIVIWLSPNKCVILGERQFVTLLRSAWEKY